MRSGQVGPRVSSRCGAAPAHFPLSLPRPHCCRANSIRSLRSPSGKRQPWAADTYLCGPALGPPSRVLISPVFSPSHHHPPLPPASVSRVGVSHQLSPGQEAETRKKNKELANPGKKPGVLGSQAGTLLTKATEPLQRLQGSLTSSCRP